MDEAALMTDEELAMEWQKVEDAIAQTKRGFFNTQLFDETLRTSRAKGMALLVHLALASLSDGNRQARLTDRELKERTNAIQLFFHLEYRAGQKRLDDYLLRSIGLQKIAQVS